MPPTDSQRYDAVPWDQTPPMAKRIRGKTTRILLSSVISTIPLILLSSVLLAIVYHFRIRHNVSGESQLSFPGEKEEAGYLYVDFQATYLMKIASLSTSVASYLTTFAIALFAYPVASAVLKNTRRASSEKLFTPYQLYLALAVLENGGILSLWSYIKYQFGSGRKDAQPFPLVGIATVGLITTALGGLLFIADLWFHFNTKSVSFSQLTPFSGPLAYSNVLPVNCTISDNSYSSQEERPCSLQTSIRGGYLVNPLPAFDVLNNISSGISVNVYHNDRPYAFLGISNNGASTGMDFVASTFSASTQCKPVTRECGLSRDGPVWTPIFTCPQYPAFTGNVLGDPFAMVYFTDFTARDNQTYGMSVSNPFYFGVSGWSAPDVGATLLLKDDPGVVSAEYGGVLYIFYCNTTIYDTNYTAINGSITSFSISQSNASVGNMMQVPMRSSAAASIKFQDAINLASLGSSAQEMADTFALICSNVVLSLVAGVMEQRPVTVAQQRRQIIASRIPISALFFLVASALLLSLFGAILSVIALAASRSDDVEEVRARLSLQHLIAEHFQSEKSHDQVESLDEMFQPQQGEDSKRIGVEKVESNTSLRRGWTFKVWTTFPQYNHSRYCTGPI